MKLFLFALLISVSSASFAKGPESPVIRASFECATESFHQDIESYRGFMQKGLKELRQGLRQEFYLEIQSSFLIKECGSAKAQALNFISKILDDSSLDTDMSFEFYVQRDIKGFFVAVTFKLK